MEVINLSMLSEDLTNVINSNFNLTTGGFKELDELPDPPPIPYMGGFQNTIKFFIWIAAAFMVISFFPVILFGLMLVFCWKFFDKIILKKVKSI
mgnify:CR=1 FL=1